MIKSHAINLCFFPSGFLILGRITCPTDHAKSRDIEKVTSTSRFRTMTEEGPRVALEDNDDGKGQEAPDPAQEGEEQAGSANAQTEQKSGWSLRLLS